MSIELMMPSNHLILWHPLLPPSIFPSIRFFTNESVLPIRWPKYWSFIFSICPSNEYSGLISFKMDWLDLFVVQETLKSLLQHHSSKASILLVLSFLYGPLDLVLFERSFLKAVWFCFIFCLHHKACCILVLWAGIEPAPLELEARSLNHWTTMEVTQLLFYKQEAGDLEGPLYWGGWGGTC